MEIVSVYPFWVYFLCFLFAGITSYFFYLRDKRLVEFSKYAIIALTVFRFLGLFTLCFLLTAPLVKYYSKTVEKPIIIIAQDNSQSLINTKDSSYIKGELEDDLNKLRDQFKDKYQLENYLFGGGMQEGVKADFIAKTTNYENLFEDIESKFVNQNVAAMLIISDGIYNEGSNPVYLTNKVDFPLYTLAVGDTIAYKDAKLQQLRNNELAFLGNDFPLEIDLKILKAKGETVLVKVYGPDGEVYSKELQIPSEDYVETLQATIEAKKVGIQQYRVEVLPIEGERNRLNNALSFYIDVLDGRQKIALLAASPHPDVSAIKKSIEDNINYELEVALIKDFNQKLSDYDLLIMHQSVLSPDYSIDSRMKHVINSNIPLLLIGDGWKLLGVQFGLKPFNDQRKGSKNEVFPILNPGFSLFTVSKSLQEQLKNFPPLLASRSTLNATSPNTVMLNQKIGAVSTKFPLLEFFEKDGRKIGRLYAENLWKWSMNDFIENKSNKNFDEFVGKIVQFLAVKADRSFFRVNSKNEYFENESIVFDAQLFNQSYELINDSEVSMKVIDEDGKEYLYQFNPSANSYKLSIASLNAGKYKYVAETDFQGKKYKEKGSITVKALQLEQLESVADHNILYQLAEKTNGKLFYPEELDNFFSIIDERDDVSAISYQNEEVEDIINLKWVFYLLMLFLATEWFIRKRGGAY